MNSLRIALHMMKRTIGRRWGFLFFIIVPPLVLSLIIGMLEGQPVKLITLDAINRDKGSLGLLLTEELGERYHYRIVKSTSVNESEDRIIGHKTDGAIVIGETFTSELLKGSESGVYSPSVVDWLVSENDEGSLAARSLLLEEIGEMAQALEQAGREGLAGDQAVSRVKDMYREANTSGAVSRVVDLGLYVNQAAVTSTGMLLLFMMGLVGVSVSVVMNDRQNKLLQRMFAAPVRAIEIAAGYFLGSLLIGSLQIVVALAVTRYVMRFDFGVPLFSHWLVLECFLLSALGVSAGIAGIVRTPVRLEAVYSLIITPTCMIGGCFWPLDIMPEAMQKLSNFVPQKWAIEAVAKLGTGSGIGDITYHLGILLLFALVLLSFGTAVLNPGETEQG